MRDPSTYTTQELSQVYKYVLYNRGDHPNGRTYISDHKGLYFGMPSDFTLQEARDRLNVSASILEKMRTVKPGETRRVTSRTRGYTDWGVYRVEPAKETQIELLEQQADRLKQQIDSLAGPLITQRDLVIKQLKALKESRTNGA
jgi:hypothetical protein